MRVVLQRLLHHQRKAIKSLAHVGVAGRQPHPDARRNRDNRRDSALTTRASDDASTSAPTTIRSPPMSTISIRRAGLAAATGEVVLPASAIVTGKNSIGSCPPTALVLPC